MNSVHLNGFSLGILTKDGPVEKVIYRNSNYYALPDKSEYKIKLGNDHNVRVDAHVWVDGIKAGIWRINPYSQVVIERPSGFRRKFTVLKEGTRGANEAGIVSGDIHNGLLKVVFKPEMPRYYHIGEIYGYDALKRDDPTIHRFVNCKDYTDTVTPESLNRHCAGPGELYQSAVSFAYSPMKNSTLSPAGTALGDYSHQRFRRTEPLIDLDFEQITTIYIRLVVDNDRPMGGRRYIAMRHAKYPNRIPPKLELRHPARPHDCDVDSRFTLSEKYYFDTF